MTRAMKGGIGHNRKAERIRLGLRDHRYAVNQSLSDAVQGSGPMVIHMQKSFAVTQAVIKIHFCICICTLSTV